MYWCVLVYRWLAQPVVDVSIVISGDSTLSLIFIKCADLTVAGTVLSMPECSLFGLLPAIVRCWLTEFACV